MQVGIIGCGPSGLYCARKILEKIPKASIAIFESKVIPFGLLRTGVAPDHPELRMLQGIFSSTIFDSRLYYFGGYKVDHDFPFDKFFDVVVDSRGTNDPNLLDLFDYSKVNIVDSKRFTEWILGINEDAMIDNALTCAKNILIIGQGNVSLDVARFLISSKFDYQNYGIGTGPLKYLSSALKKNVSIIGRQGPLNVHKIL